MHHNNRTSIFSHNYTIRITIASSLNNRASPLLDNNIATIIIALISPCSNEEDLCVNGSSKTEEWYYQHSSWIHHAAREL